MTKSPEPTRPYRILRAFLKLWLLGWGISILLFITNQFSPDPLFKWSFALIWVGISALGWWIIFRVLQRLRALPPEQPEE
ncbi:MAG: hypothetical protein L3J37_01125 [Rhodobacteraceae bacterium]|nr:hypothetical protein [Paracoccaceae bacterium]